MPLLEHFNCLCWASLTVQVFSIAEHSQRVSSCLRFALGEVHALIDCLDFEDSHLSAYASSFGACGQCSFAETVLCAEHVGDESFGFGVGGWYTNRSSVADSTVPAFCRDLCCGVSTTYPGKLVPASKMAEHCESDAIGRDLCHSPVCVTPANSLIMPGRTGAALLGWPPLSLGLNLINEVQLAWEMEYTFDFPRGFEWKTLDVEGAQMFGIRIELDAFNQLPIEETIEDGPVLLLGWGPGPTGPNIGEFWLFAFGILSARAHFKIEEWKAVHLYDPGGWVEQSEWHRRVFELLLWPIKSTIQIKKPPSSTACYPNAYFTGHYNRKFAGPREAFLLRRLVAASYPEVLQRKAHVLWVHRPLGWARWRRGVINHVDVEQGLRDRVASFVTNFSFAAEVDGELRSIGAGHSFLEELQLWSRAGIAVSMYGAALANVVFMPFGAHVLCIDPPVNQGHPLYSHYEPTILHGIRTHHFYLKWSDAVCDPEERLVLGGHEAPQPNEAPVIGSRHIWSEVSTGLLAGLRQVWWHSMEHCAYYVEVASLVNQFDAIFDAAFSFIREEKIIPGEQSR